MREVPKGMIRVGSLCSGYGGLDLGFHRAISGAETVWVAEYDPSRRRQVAARVLEERFPGVPNLGDITTLDWTLVPPVDVLLGGTPCQDLSLAGRRTGMHGHTRSGLWSSMVGAVEELRPSLVVWENVKGARSASATSKMESCAGCLGERGRVHPLRALGRVLGDLANLGYDAEWVSVTANAVGAPHRRERVFVAAYPDGVRFGGDRRERYTAEGSRCSSDVASPPGSWGAYEMAVRVWERTVGRAAPYPTEVNPNSPYDRTRPEWIEWMMGLPPGWVTEVPGLSRADQIHILGNGVIPQQAEEAIRELLRG